MLETHTRVVPLHDVAEVIGVRLDGRVILVIDVVDLLQAEGTLLHARIRAPARPDGRTGWPLLLSLLSYDDRRMSSRVEIALAISYRGVKWNRYRR